MDVCCLFFLLLHFASSSFSSSSSSTSFSHNIHFIFRRWARLRVLHSQPMRGTRLWMLCALTLLRRLRLGTTANVLSSFFGTCRPAIVRIAVFVLYLRTFPTLSPFDSKLLLTRRCTISSTQLTAFAADPAQVRSIRPNFELMIAKYNNNKSRNEKI